jgi:citrate lyase beta subunit
MTLGASVTRDEPIECVLFVPGSRPERFAKALASGADLVCIDLEDAVAPADKDSARRAALDALAGADAARLALRINGLATAEGLRDLLTLRERGARPAALFLPMVDGPGQLAIAAAVLEGDLPLVPLIETAAALRDGAAIAAAPGVAGVMFGGGDLAAELGVELAWEPLAAARGQFVLACAGGGRMLLDVPYLGIGDDGGLRRESERARALGFTAKAAIHPAQVEVIRAAFAPSGAELAEARAALAAFAAARGEAVRHNGKLLEAPLVRRYEAMIRREETRGDA